MSAAFPRPITAMANERSRGERIDWHSHDRAQLIYAAAGVMTVSAEAGYWVVVPGRGLWVPPGVPHALTMNAAVSLRSLYIAPQAIPSQGLRGRCRVVMVSPLLRALILRAVELPSLYDVSGPAGRLMQVILDEIKTLPEEALHLPQPNDKRLLRITRELTRDPADPRTLTAWATQVGASERTLARLFQRETGMSFRAWRQQSRLLAALVRLGQGTAVTSVALEVGYDSPSAFIAAFKRSLGITPSHYFRGIDWPE